MTDADQTVLICPPNGDVWLGYCDGELWFAVDGMPVTVTYWLDLPEPPNQTEDHV